MKQYRLYIILAVAGVALLVFLQSLTPKPINWEPTFSKQDRIPYGSYILYDMLPELFGNVEITTVREPVYNVLTEQDAATPATYMFLNDEFDIDEYDTEELLSFIAAGNTVFIAAEDLPTDLSDTFHLELDTRWGSGAADSVGINLVNPALHRDRGYFLSRISAWKYFSEFDTAHAVVLGTNQFGDANYIRFSYGDGALLLNLVPTAFTNYHLVDPLVQDYAFNALSYLPEQPILWDEYYKIGRGEAQTPLRFVLSNESLRWAYWITITTILLYVIFESKRRQRIIPIVPPVTNTTLEFVDTVGRLYHQHGNHRNIAEKKIAYLLEHIRSNLNELTREIDEEFCERIAVRTGIDQERIIELFQHIKSTLDRPSITEAQLTRLNTQIEEFYRDSNR